MHAQIQKWGNSLGIRIPKTIAKKLSFKEGAIVNLEISATHLVISSEMSELDILLNDISDENIHHEKFKHNKVVGKELW
jgi:antitoxin MazE